ncbi:MAG: thioredoxin [Tannerellaceae bacterium]|nr:thioredoxin [Tannerellaceae bacterium]
MKSFDEIIKGDKPILVNFFATWCGPCKAMTPVVETIGKEMQGTARVLKIDIDKNEELTNQYRIQSVPTFLIFKGGEVVWRKSGVIDKNTLVQEIQNAIG